MGDWGLVPFTTQCVIGQSDYQKFINTNIGMEKKKKYTVKGWACVSPKGVLKMESFFVKDYMAGKATFAVFKRTKPNPDKEPIPNPTWGYAVDGEIIVPCTITYTI
jgi:hypothetical protein